MPCGDTIDAGAPGMYDGEMSEFDENDVTIEHLKLVGGGGIFA